VASPAFFTCCGEALRACRKHYRDLFAGCCAYFPFGQAYGAPNFNTLLALHSTNMEESTEILTIFPWYSYVVGLFIFALGVIAIRRQQVEKNPG
jgi:glucan phosphoethanolaminetransferase (alkaline phosphatase superfamily)